MTYKPPTFNPLDYGAISDSLADFLMKSPLVHFSDVEPFYGGGVYALFYTGSFPAYHRLAEQNSKEPGSWPIYIGKSSPSTRKGIDDLRDADAPEAGSGLFKRVCNNHFKSIDNAVNLTTDDFQIRMVVLSSIWVPLAESAMISRYSPLWNSIVDGFGNHDPGSGRAGTKLSVWDRLHPGRPWADKYRKPEDAASVPQITEKISAYLEDQWQLKFRADCEF